jgi:hypothetical protein
LAQEKAKCVVNTSDTLTAVLVAGPTHGQLTLNADGTYICTPGADCEAASDSFTYKVIDNHGGESVVNEGDGILRVGGGSGIDNAEVGQAFVQSLDTVPVVVIARRREYAQRRSSVVGVRADVH